MGFMLHSLNNFSGVLLSGGSFPFPFARHTPLRKHVRLATVAAAVHEQSTMGKVKRVTVPLRSPKGPASTHFKVLQWNILADGLAQNGDFVKVDPKVLEWEFRVPLVLEEIKESEADLICLQELNHYEQFQAMLQELGYIGAFLPKHCSPAERYNCPPDGLALFYRSSRFTRVGEPKGKRFYGNDGHIQSQGFLQVCLRDVVVGQNLCLVTTHLKAKEGVENEQVRVSQAHQMLDVVCAPLDKGNAGNGTCGSNNCQDLPIIICGDFNTTPESLACQTLQSHPRAFKSLWQEQNLLNGGSCSEFTTWKYRSKGESKRTIDYIWFSGEGRVKPVNRWRMLTEDEIGPNALPSCHYASDHISVCCQFEWDLSSPPCLPGEGRNNGGVHLTA